MQTTAKKVSESKVQQVQIVMNGEINGMGRLFGGKLMEWIDVVSAVVARRHCNCEVTTVAVDNLQFKAAAYINNTIVLEGQITYVGTTSMEVRVNTFVESLSGEKQLVNQAYLVMVALDANEHPTPVPQLILETDEERQEWEAGKRRNQLRKQRRIEQF